MPLHYVKGKHSPQVPGGAKYSVPSDQKDPTPKAQCRAGSTHSFSPALSTGCHSVLETLLPQWNSVSCDTGGLPEEGQEKAGRNSPRQTPKAPETHSPNMY